ncbi:glycosyltransferase family 4 protein [Staphylococcus arlettae]|uniref:Glycoside hydrolase n=1 Tax=Staphylococcus arlettae TaxID=29378 RepID=A0A380C3L0_9STAP|nr:MULTISPECIES: glycosyltransferase family 4 protein [Staphylococcus]KAB2479137.1 glycosyltransferase family 4 protein [Staphylococcus sp. CH99b_3]MBK3719630.1 Glycosyltransferase Gtf1 [Staphylococcus arlettae]MCD8839078.1 glycosyltransferase family 4 protein [Staphylococcus arlettae]MCD8841881.1 glycosyltransferase family 4 protein [Staphylococcus arlettae]MCD8849968.1 glycosyltransferase family 4 protein [Staphylococcus arlettae]
MQSITFFMHNIFAMGGTVKSISELANVLANKGHPVTIISVFKSKEMPYFELHPDIKIQTLIDYTHIRSNLKSAIFNRVRKYTKFLKPKVLSRHEPGLNQFSSYIERKMIHAIKTVDCDVLIGTRASFNILIAQHGPYDVTKVGMEHMNFDAHPTAYQQEIIEAYRSLDKITTLTSVDQQRYQNVVQTPVFVVPNVLNEQRLDLPKDKIILAAGRLEYEKGFDLLINSIQIIQDVIRQFNYRVHIYGSGQQRKQLEQLISQHQLDDIVSIFDTTQSLSTKLAESELTIIPSRNEGFGMVILEAMNQSSIVISFDGIAGPDSIIKNNINGYLVEHGDIKALAFKIQRLLNQEFKYNTIIKHGYETVEQYSPDAIYTRFSTMLKH